MWRIATEFLWYDNSELDRKQMWEHDGGPLAVLTARFVYLCLHLALFVYKAGLPASSRRRLLPVCSSCAWGPAFQSVGRLSATTVPCPLQSWPKLALCLAVSRRIQAQGNPEDPRDNYSVFGCSYGRCGTRLDALDGHQGDDRRACLPVIVDCAGYIFEIIVVSIAECAHIKESN
jgi:hypothetical protein